VNSSVPSLITRLTMLTSQAIVLRLFILHQHLRSEHLLYTFFACSALCACKPSVYGVWDLARQRDKK